MTVNANNLERWHRAVLEKDMDLLAELLHKDVEFHSPTVWQPKQGREIVHYILSMISDIFENFTYHREWMDGDSFALEFSAEVQGKSLKGIDLIRWNEQGQIVHFEVMLRPLNALNLVFAEMTHRLQDAGFIPKD
ncbi:nuclear transport factor 2 family protein [Pseudomaricurvus alkylphenolicus]|nr:nuclear transport factor 2 family protein [Pseudomaricurvus alkylphenolicus]NIB43698.1 nuclear transport factor 2 family protein [Pseudomaricurvus alkylphenolicus]